MPIHQLLDEARLSASRYAVLPSERGFNVWRFRSWSSSCGGWRIVVADLKTREDAWLHVLRRLGLLQQTPPDPLPPAPAKATWTEMDEGWP